MTMAEEEGLKRMENCDGNIRHLPLLKLMTLPAFMQFHEIPKTVPRRISISSRRRKGRTMKASALLGAGWEDYSHLDLATAIKVSEALSGEIVLEKLSDPLMRAAKSRPCAATEVSFV